PIAPGKRPSGSAGVPRSALPHCRDKFSLHNENSVTRTVNSVITEKWVNQRSQRFCHKAFYLNDLIECMQFGTPSALPATVLRQSTFNVRQEPRVTVPKVKDFRTEMEK